jgi:hypothetical protein
MILRERKADKQQSIQKQGNECGLHGMASSIKPKNMNSIGLVNLSGSIASPMLLYLSGEAEQHNCNGNTGQSARLP